jgi:hypothetical protein
MMNIQLMASLLDGRQHAVHPPASLRISLSAGSNNLEERDEE